MERDFMGIHGRDAGDGPRRGLQDADLIRENFSALSGNPNVQWVVMNKPPAGAVPQQFMLYNAVQEEKPRSNILDKQSPSRFQPVYATDAFEANLKAPHHSLGVQKRPNHSGQVFNQYLFNNANQPRSTGSFDASRHQLNEAIAFPVLPHQNIPVTSSSHPLYKVQNAHCGPNLRVGSPKPQSFGGGNVNSHPGGPVVGTFAPRNMPKPTHASAQLTIFYAGCVNVYDDVPMDKVQEIMSLASKGPSATSNAVNSRSEAFLPTTAMAPTKVVGSNSLSAKQSMIPLPKPAASPCSGRSSPISVTSHTMAISVTSHTMVSPGCGRRTNGDTTGTKASSPVVPTSQKENSKTSSAAVGSEAVASNKAKAIPQARKASLARFLEKRKERLTNVMPYSCSKMYLENIGGLESCNVSSISSSADINLSSNREESWLFPYPKGSMDSGES